MGEEEGVFVGERIGVGCVEWMSEEGGFELMSNEGSVGRRVGMCDDFLFALVGCHAFSLGIQLFLF